MQASVCVTSGVRLCDSTQDSWHLGPVWSGTLSPPGQSESTNCVIPSSNLPLTAQQDRGMNWVTNCFNECPCQPLPLHLSISTLNLQVYLKGTSFRMCDILCIGRACRNRSVGLLNCAVETHERASLSSVARATHEQRLAVSSLYCNRASYPNDTSLKIADLTCQNSG